MAFAYMVNCPSNLWEFSHKSIMDRRLIFREGGICRIGHLHCRRDAMPKARPLSFAMLKWLMVSMVAVITLETESMGRGSQASDLGPQVEKKIQIKVSVRPIMRIHKLRPTDASNSFCLWSNIPIEKFIVRAELSDGRFSEFRMKDNTIGACNYLGEPLVRAGTLSALQIKQVSNTTVTFLVTPE